MGSRALRRSREGGRGGGLSAWGREGVSERPRSKGDGSDAPRHARRSLRGLHTHLKRQVKQKAWPQAATEGSWRSDRQTGQL